MLLCCGDGFVDLLFVYVVVKEIVEVMDGYIVVVIKLMVLVGIGDEVECIICEICFDVDFVVVLNLEFF